MFVLPYRESTTEGEEYTSGLLWCPMFIVYIVLKYFNIYFYIK